MEILLTGTDERRAQDVVRLRYPFTNLTLHDCVDALDVRIWARSPKGRPGRWRSDPTDGGLHPEGA